jgi:HlyD family secretion protein
VNVAQLSGPIEGDDSAVAPKTAGRIIAITVREGDVVKAGQTIATLDDEQVRAREAQARSALLGAQARSQSASDQIAILEEQVKQYQLQSEQAQSDAEGRVRQNQLSTRSDTNGGSIFPPGHGATWGGRVVPD